MGDGREHGVGLMFDEVVEHDLITQTFSAFSFHRRLSLDQAIEFIRNAERFSSREEFMSSAVGVSPIR